MSKGVALPTSSDLPTPPHAFRLPTSSARRVHTVAADAALADTVLAYTVLAYTVPADTAQADSRTTSRVGSTTCR
jgi:hypothetical protein